MLACLFEVFRREFFTHLETITGEVLQILNYARQFRGPVKPTPIAKRLAVELSLHVLTT